MYITWHLDTSGCVTVNNWIFIIYNTISNDSLYTFITGKIEVQKKGKAKKK